MNNPFILFLLRWFLNSIALWAAVRVFGTGYDNIDIATNFSTYLVAGLIFSLINAILKPVLVILSLPAIFLSLGFFMLIVNGILVYISLLISPNIAMSFFNSIITGMLISLVNYIVSSISEIGNEK